MPTLSDTQKDTKILLYPPHKIHGGATHSLHGRDEHSHHILPRHNPSNNRIAIRLPSLRLSPSIDKFLSTQRWLPLVSFQPLQRHMASCCLCQCRVVSPNALAAGVPSLSRSGVRFCNRPDETWFIVECGTIPACSAIRPRSGRHTETQTAVRGEDYCSSSLPNHCPHASPG